jgi:hypothetical protein
LLVAIPLTLAAAAVLSTAPIPMSSTVSEAKEITVAQKQGCRTNITVCSYGGCEGRNPTTGQPVKGVEGFEGAELQRCLKACDNKYKTCMKTGSWPNRVIGRGGGSDVKTKPGGVATVPTTPGKHSTGTLPNGPGGVVAQPKGSPHSPPIGSNGIKQQTGGFGSIGITQQTGPTPSGPILRSGGRR